MKIAEKRWMWRMSADNTHEHTYTYSSAFKCVFQIRSIQNFFILDLSLVIFVRLKNGTRLVFVSFLFLDFCVFGV